MANQTTACEDYSSPVSERDYDALTKIKELEKKKAKRLKRVNIAGGYVLTTNPSKYDKFKR